MLRFAVLLGLVAFCAAHKGIDHCCSSEDRRIVQKQWNSLWTDVRSSRVKIALGTKLIQKLIELKPEVKDVLQKVNVDEPTSGLFQAYAFRVLNSVDALLNILDDSEALDAAIDQQAKKYGSVAHIKKEHFKTFGQILLEALPRVLDDFDAFSWKSCFKYVGQRVTAGLHE